LKPPLAVIDGKLSVHASSFETTLLSLRTDSASIAIVDSTLRFYARSATDSIHRKKTVIISESLSKTTGLEPGDTFSIAYDGRFSSLSGGVRLIVTAVTAQGCGIDGPVVLVNEKDFYKAFYDVWPKSTVAEKDRFVPILQLASIKRLGVSGCLFHVPERPGML
jgi:hypothetical protein